MNRFLQTAKYLQIKKLVESVLSRNSLFSQEQNANKYNQTISNGDASNQGILSNNEVLNDRQSVSSIADELINLNIPSYNPGSDELGSGKALYKCEDCEATYKRKESLLQHTRSKHEGIVYSCQQCSYKATTQGSLKMHQESIHEGVKYSCNQCEYQATRKYYLKTHKKSLHASE